MYRDNNLQRHYHVEVLPLQLINDGLTFEHLFLFKGNASNSEEDQNISSTENQSVSNTQRLLEPKSHAHHTKIDVIRKEHAKNTQRYKYDSQSTDTLNFSSESKQETEYVSNFYLTEKATYMCSVNITLNGCRL